MSLICRRLKRRQHAWCVGLLTVALVGASLAMTAPAMADATLHSDIALNMPAHCIADFGASYTDPNTQGYRVLDDADSQNIVDADPVSRSHYVGTLYSPPGYMNLNCGVELDDEWALDRVEVDVASAGGNATFLINAGFSNYRDPQTYSPPSFPQASLHESQNMVYEFDRYKHRVNYFSISLKWEGDGTGIPKDGWGFANITVTGVKPGDLGIPSSEEELLEAAWVDPIVPVAAVAMGAADVVLGTADPAVTPTQEQTDEIVAMTDAVLSNAPVAEVEVVSRQAALSWQSLDSSLLTASEDAYYRSVETLVAPLVRQYAGVRLPGPLSYFWKNRSVATVCASWPYECARSRGADEQAYAQQHRLYPRMQGHWDEGDAFRHCYWQALVLKRTHLWFAYALGKAHEEDGRRAGNSRIDSAMDTHNNGVGRTQYTSGASDNTLSQRCYFRQIQGHRLGTNEWPSGSDTNLVWIITGPR